MHPAYATFREYQAEYENSILPVAVREALSEVKSSFHHVVVIIDEWVQGPEIVVKAVQMGATLLSFVPSFEPILEGPKQICKDIKIVTGLAKGFRSIDSLLNITAAWKVVVLQISSVTLFALSILSFIERFELFQTTTIKVMLAAIPIFGVLPYGGLMVLSLGSLSVTLLCFSIDKKNKLDQEEHTLIHDKLVFWSKPLDFSNVEQKQLKYAEKTKEYTDEIKGYEAILEEGLNIEDGLIKAGAERKKIVACRKAIEMLTDLVSNKKEALRKHEEKYGNWDLLKKQWSTVDPQELELFRLAKAGKWRIKLNRIRFEKKANLFSMTSSAILIFKQIVTLGGLFSNRVFLPLGANVALELIGTGCGLTNFFMKRILKQKKIPSVELSSYITFKPNRAERHLVRNPVNIPARVR